MPSGSDIPEHLQRFLRLLTIGDETAVNQALSGLVPTRLDPKTSALVTIAALVATEAEFPSYQSATERALAAGASSDEILQTLVTIAPLVGAARMTAATPEVTSALAGNEATFE
jgi:alkylhydroperoxidase/carboxymuconolactone decarboxylase family protein YurZ